jgi:hypothetical protein
MQSAVQISAASNVVFTGGNYTQMGAGGVGIGNDANAHASGVGLGATNVAIRDAFFSQIMGNSITAGGVRADAHHPSNPKMLNSKIEISGNIFRNVSSLFSATVPIFASYVQSSTISHNDIDIAPYSGICLGFGWGSNDAGGSPEYEKRGLYTFQPKYTTPTENYAYDSSGFGLYTDEGSNSYSLTNNVLLSNGIWLAQNGVNTANNVITGNTGKNGGARQGNFIVSDLSKASADAKRVASRAGVLPERRAGRPVSNPN